MAETKKPAEKPEGAAETPEPAASGQEDQAAEETPETAPKAAETPEPAAASPKADISPDNSPDASLPPLGTKGHRSKGSPAGTRKAYQHAGKPAGKPGLAVPMSWVVFGSTLDAVCLDHGIRFATPKVFATLNRLRAEAAADGRRKFPEGANAVVVPLPTAWGNGLVANFGKTVVKVASGHLPDLHVYPDDYGHNSGLWSDYQAAHRPKSAVMTREDWLKEVKVG